MDWLMRYYFSDSDADSDPSIEPDPHRRPWNHPAVDIDDSVLTPPASLWSDMDINDGYGSGEGEGDTFVYDCEQCGIEIGDIEALCLHLLDGGRTIGMGEVAHVVCPLCLKEFVGEDTVEREREMGRHFSSCPLTNAFFEREERLLPSQDRASVCASRSDDHGDGKYHYYASNSSAVGYDPDSLLFDLDQDLSSGCGCGCGHSGIKLGNFDVHMDINTTICPQEEGEGPGIEIERKLQKKTSGNLDMELPAEAVADIDVMLPSTAQLKRNLEEEEEEEEMKGSYGCGCYQWVRIPGPGCDPAGIENLDLEKIRAEWRQEMMWLEEFEGA